MKVVEADRVAFDKESNLLVVDVSCTAAYCGNPMRMFIPMEEISAYTDRPPIPTVEELERILLANYGTEPDNLTEGEMSECAYDSAQAIHALLTARPPVPTVKGYDVALDWRRSIDTPQRGLHQIVTHGEICKLGEMIDKALLTARIGGSQ